MKELIGEMTEESKMALKAWFWSAPLDSDHEQETIALAYGYSLSWMQAKRSNGGGPRFRKVGRKILYKKRDVLAFFDHPPIVQSTSQYAMSYA